MASVKPEFKTLYESLQTEKAALDKIVMPLRAKRDALAATIAPVEAQMRELAQEIQKHNPRYAEVCSQLADLAKSLGGKALSTAPAA